MNRAVKTIKTRVIVTGVILLFNLCNLWLLSPAQAQPSWVKKATKSVFTLKTFAADGSLIASSMNSMVSK